MINSNQIQEDQALEAILDSIRATCLFRECARTFGSISPRRKDGEFKQDWDELDSETRLWILTAQSAEKSGIFKSSYCFFLRSYAIESVNEYRLQNNDYEEIASLYNLIDSIKKREGLGDDEYWRLGEGPEQNFWELDKQFSQALDDRMECALREYGLDGMANLWSRNRNKYDSEREKGRVLSLGKLSDIDHVIDIQMQFEAEAEACAECGAYYAATTMIGSAIEALLLSACLKNNKKASVAWSLLPKQDRPKNKDPMEWRLADLILIAEAAGWLPKFEKIDDDNLLLIRLQLNLMRCLRNLIHPSLNLSDRLGPNMKSMYSNALATYVLMKSHLKKINVSGNVSE